MNEEPPKCLLRCCNVRSWTIAVSIIDIVILTILILLDIGSITTSPASASFSISICFFFLFIDIKLINGVFKHDIASIRLWLWVYLVMYILLTLTIIVSILNISFGGLQNTEYEKLKDHVPLIILFCIIIEGFVVLCYYPVYQLYIFEKTRLQRIGTSTILETV